MARPATGLLPDDRIAYIRDNGEEAEVVIPTGSIAEARPAKKGLMKRVVIDRSVVMAYRMQRELRRGGAFVAVGALHLYGARGVLAHFGFSRGERVISRTGLR